MLRPGHFEAARSQPRPGELISVSAHHDDRGGRAPEAATATRAALVMVSENARGVLVAARLVQDFGGPDLHTPLFFTATLIRYQALDLIH